MALDTSGRARLSPQMMNKLREQRKLQRKKVAGDVAAAVGASAESFRTGASAPGVFKKWMPDRSDSYMTSQQKMALSKDIYAEQEKSEQYYFGKALATAKEKARIAEGNARRQLEYNKDMARRSDSARFRRQTALNSIYDREVRQYNVDLKRLEKPSPGTEIHFKDMPSYEDRVTAEANATWENLPTANKKAFIKKAGSARNAISSLKNHAQVQERATEAAKADAKQRLESFGAGNPQDKDMVWAVNEAAEKSGTVPDEIYKSLDANTQAKATEAERNVGEEIEGINKEKERIYGGYEKETISLAEASGDPNVPGAYVGIEEREKFSPGLAERETRKLGATRAEMVEEIDPDAVDVTADILDKQAAEREEALRRQQEERTAAIGTASDAAGEVAWMGIPGVKKPVGGAQAHFRGLLDVIEKFPDAEPAQYAKQQIMAGEEFKNYQAKHFGGIEGGDSNIAWKEMVRDWRKQNKETNQALRQARVHKRVKERDSTDPCDNRSHHPYKVRAQGKTPAAQI